MHEGNFKKRKMSNYIENHNRYDPNDYSLSNNNLSGSDLLKALPFLTMEKVIELVSGYPDYKYTLLKDSIYGYYDINSLVLGSGSEELIVRINSYLKKNQKRIGVLMPNFYRIFETASPYHPLLISYSCDSEFISINKNIDLSGVDALWVTNPNPIIGKIFPKEELVELMTDNPGVLFIVDEGAMDFVINADSYSLIHESKRCNNLIILKSFSKLFGLAGMRIGFVTGNSVILESLENMSATFPVNSLGEYILCEILKTKKFAENILSNIHKNKKCLEDILANEMSLKLCKSVTNCIFISNKNNESLFRILKDVGITTLDLKYQEGIGDKNVLRLTSPGSWKIFAELKDKLLSLKGGVK